MITEEIKAMSQTISEMARDQLDPKEDSFTLCVHDGDGQNIFSSYGHMTNIGTTFIAGFLRFIEELPEEIQGPVVRAEAKTLVDMWEEEHEKE